jgi:hypothetical protein
MRLLYVVSSDAARQANEERYTTFIAMAERHFEDLRGSLAIRHSPWFYLSPEKHSPATSALMDARPTQSRRVRLVESDRVLPVMRQTADAVEENSV